MNQLPSPTLLIGSRELPVTLVRHARARRYRLRVGPGGDVRLTLPARGSAREALAFAVEQTAWIERQLLRQAAAPVIPAVWQAGTPLLYRGTSVALRVTAQHDLHEIAFGDQRFAAARTTDLRRATLQHLRRLAERELPGRTQELAARHGLRVAGVSVRDQRSRWGSCSRRGTISLNWRLIQMPDHVRDYVILHELMHLRELNHSPRFWLWVAEVCPQYSLAKEWLRAQRGLLA